MAGKPARLQTRRQYYKVAARSVTDKIHLCPLLLLLYKEACRRHLLDEFRCTSPVLVADAGTEFARHMSQQYYSFDHAQLIAATGFEHSAQPFMPCCGGPMVVRSPHTWWLGLVLPAVLIGTGSAGFVLQTLIRIHARRRSRTRQCGCNKPAHGYCLNFDESWCQSRMLCFARLQGAPVRLRKLSSKSLAALAPAEPGAWRSARVPLTPPH